MVTVTSYSPVSGYKQLMVVSLAVTGNGLAGEPAEQEMATVVPTSGGTLLVMLTMIGARWVVLGAKMPPHSISVVYIAGIGIGGKGGTCTGGCTGGGGGASLMMVSVWLVVSLSWVVSVMVMRLAPMMLSGTWLIKNCPASVSVANCPLMVMALLGGAR